MGRKGYSRVARSLCHMDTILLIQKSSEKVTSIMFYYLILIYISVYSHWVEEGLDMQIKWFTFIQATISYQVQEATAILNYDDDNLHQC